MYHCLYNLELLIIGTARTPFQSYDEPVRKETPANYVRQLKDTDVDAIMICPTAWKRPLWDSQVDPHWKTEADSIKQPYFSADLKYHEKAYFRLRDYMRQGNDPVAMTVETAKELGIAPFISYRMNDHHYLKQKDAFVHPKFWKEHPEYWLSPTNRHFDYMHDEVRDYYFALLQELVSRYDIAGLELDFMRSPIYFKESDVETGREIMTGFVRKIRALLDEWGEKRGKRLSLCVRVPNTLSWCAKVGLDVARWDQEGLIDMVNVSSYFISSPCLELKEYKEIAPNSAIYGEMHYIIDKTRLLNGFENNCARPTTKEIYRSLAATFLDQGADGLSFFNFDYCRDHYFNEARRYHIKDGEPPHEELRGITDVAALAVRDKHYFVGTNYGPLPMVNNMDVVLYVADKDIPERFNHAILRVKTKDPCERVDIGVSVNGHAMEEIIWMGELFPPLSIEGMTRPEYVKYYQVPVEILNHGENQICARNLCEDPTLWDKRVEFTMVELALYKNNSFLEGSK